MIKTFHDIRVCEVPWADHWDHCVKSIFLLLVIVQRGRTAARGVVVVYSDCLGNKKNSLAPAYQAKSHSTCIHTNTQTHRYKKMQSEQNAASSYSRPSQHPPQRLLCSTKMWEPNTMTTMMCRGCVWCHLVWHSTNQKVMDSWASESIKYYFFTNANPLFDEQTDTEFYLKTLSSAEHFAEGKSEVIRFFHLICDFIMWLNYQRRCFHGVDETWGGIDIRRCKWKEQTRIWRNSLESWWYPG